MADGQLTVIARPHALRHDAVQASFRAGLSLREIVGPDPEGLLRITIAGEDVPRCFWPHLRPKAGVLVYVQVGMQGGGSGGKLLRVVALMAVAVFAPELAGYMTGEFGLLAGASTALVTGALTMVGGLIVNALLPPPMPKMPHFGSFQRLNSFTGTGNHAGPYEPIPMVLGESQFFPPHAALPYVETSGNDQYLRMMLDLGYGDVAVSNILIGSTPIANYTDVETEISATPSLFSDSIFEASLGVTLSDRGVSINTTNTATDEIGVDLSFDAGLFGVDSNGHTVAPICVLYVEYSPAGLNQWVSACNATGLTISTTACAAANANSVPNIGPTGDVQGKQFNVTGGARSNLRIGLRWKVTNGQYDVRFTRWGVLWNNATADGQVGTTTTWSMLRSIRYTNPSTTGTLKLALRIKATDQLNQTISNLSVFGQQLLPVYNSSTSTWSAPQVTANPAWIYYWLLTSCPAFKRTVPASRVDLTRISEWATFCDTYALTCKGVLDATTTAFDVLKQVLAAGLGSFAMRDSLYSVVWDVQQTTPVQMFTPANSWGFKGMRTFTQLPDALRVRFVNPEANWQDDEVVVYAPGQSAATAAKFETLQTKYVADGNQAWRIGSYHLAVGINRPNTYTFDADIENIVCTRGDLIAVAHDVTEWGDGWGRVNGITANGTTATITLDNAITLATGQSYSLRARDDTGTQIIGAITTGAGETNVLAVNGNFTTVQPGDLVVVGVTNSETARLIVTKITPGADLSAQITCVDEGPAIYTAWTGTPPAFVSQITGQIWETPPPAPNITAVFSDQILSLPGDSGTTTPRIGAGISMPSGRIGMGTPGLRFTGLAR